MGHDSVEGIVAAVELDDDEDAAVPIGGGGTCRAGHEQRHRWCQGQQGRLQKRSTCQHGRFLSVQASCARGDDSRIVTACASPGAGSVPKRRRWWNRSTESASEPNPYFLGKAVGL